MGFTEDQVMQMTPRKFFGLFDEFLIMNGQKKETTASIDFMP